MKSLQQYLGASELEKAVYLDLLAHQSISFMLYSF